eukprot:CAMPEP_0197590300 /NCGR_PEP_ID=MMETSP1326-20131121/10934_1 /TAXON_ID=1155430 /ORGANISM="Genus nov. species nov., Strain RCC2288" /LENGTH=83 /DNA_ID=CAMNT_0043155319 /DNA_START=98 /DNA_END=349 /DNA_ORIENTATION=+
MIGTVSLVGAGFGFGMQLYINALRKFPLLRNPWEHVFWTGAGVAFANWNVEFEKKLTKRVEIMNAERQAANSQFMESILKREK